LPFMYEYDTGFNLLMPLSSYFDHCFKYQCKYLNMFK